MNISVVIPCYRAGLFLLEAVRSVLEQRGQFTLLEILVVDDGSDDDETRGALAEAALLDRVSVLQNTGPKGSASARNCGINAARGEWVVFLDADDWLLPDSIKARVDAQAAFPAAEWVGGDFITAHRDGSIDSAGRFEANLESYSFLRAAFAPKRRPICLRRPVKEFLHQAPTHTIVSMVSRRLLQRVGGFDEHLLRQQDYHLFLRLAASADFVFAPALVAKYRLHQTNSTRSQVQTQEWRIVALSRLVELREFNDFRSGLSTAIGGLHLSNSYLYRSEGKFSEARQSAWKALRFEPLSLRTWKSLVAAAMRR